MNTLDISTDPALLDVELPRQLLESPSVSNFLPEEEASTCPLLSNTNGTSTPLTFSHPLTPCVDGNDSSNTSAANLCNDDDDGKAADETSSSTGSSSGIGMDAHDSATSALFNKLSNYQHLQNNNNAVLQDANSIGANGNMALSKDAPSFVSWNWPLIRKCTFFAFMSSLLGMFVLVVAMIITLPNTCNPKTAWYRGSVFYEIFPASFQDSNNDGLGDIRGIGSRIDYLASMGVAAVRLNSIFPSPHYPDDYDNITSLTEVATVLGGVGDLQQLSESLHARNISLILDLPLNRYVKELGKSIEAPRVSALLSSMPDTNESTPTTTPRPMVTTNTVTEAIQKWIAIGVDGFYLRGLEKFANDGDLLNNLASWKQLIGSDRVLMVSEPFVDALSESQRDGNFVANILSHIDLVDVHLNVLNGTKNMEERIKAVLSGTIAPRDDGAWIHWSIGGVEKDRITGHMGNANITLTATIMQLMLPGTPSIFYGDEIALEGASDPHNEHRETKHLHHLTTMQWSNTSFQFTNRETLPWLPEANSYTFENFKIISEMIELRDRSPAIYKNAICKTETPQQNTQVLRSHDDILVVERIYPRRNSFVSISNFGLKHVSMDMTSLYYSGYQMLGKSHKDKIYFKKFEIGPLETIVVKLDK